MRIPTFQDALDARARIAPYIHQTPVLTSQRLNEATGAQLFFKCENFQKAGAFKVRGASNAVFGLDDATAMKGVATHSSGNHALSLSYAAGCRGIPCHVVMPRTAPQAKKDAVRGYGGLITECEPSTSVARGCVCRGRVPDMSEFRPSLQRPARDCRAGNLLHGTHGTNGRPRRGGCADRRRWG